MFRVQFVLRGAGQGDVAGHVPDGAVLVVLGLGMLIDVLLDALALDFLEALDGLEIHAVLVVDPAVGIAHGDDFAASCVTFSFGINGYVARTGNDNALAGKRFALDGLEHFFHQICKAVAGSLGAGQGTARRAGPCR